MFAPKAAQSQTSPAATPDSHSAHQRSKCAKHGLGCGVAAQAHTLGKGIGDPGATHPAAWSFGDVSVYPPERTVSAPPARAMQPKLGGREAPRSVHEVLRSPGQPLNAPTRAFFEPRFGHDFSHVRVHTDTMAAESARAVNALAYTVGPNVVFARDQYVPGTTDGGKLLAHELAHVVQHSSQDKTYPQLGRVLRQADASKEDARNNQDTHDAQPGQDIHITDDLGFEPDDTQLQRSVDPALAPLQIQRDPDFPPPPPAFPTGPQMALEMDNTVLIWNLTCADRRERGYAIQWDDTTKKSFHGDVFKGDPAKCGQAPELNFKLPPDDGHIWTVGFLHTHPPAGPHCTKTKVGPSETDRNLAKDRGLPGIVMDNSRPQATCADEPDGGFYFFGPTVRDHY
jgi:hypothetical protein